MSRAVKSNPGELLTFDEVARRCGVHKATVRRAVARGELVVVNAPGTTGNKGKRVTSASLQAYLQRQSGSRCR